MISAELKLFELNEAPKKARVLMAHRRLRQYLFQVSQFLISKILLPIIIVPRARWCLSFAWWCGLFGPTSL
jgi:hypothetical protein